MEDNKSGQGFWEDATPRGGLRNVFFFFFMKLPLRSSVTRYDSRVVAFAKNLGSTEPAHAN